MWLVEKARRVCVLVGHVNDYLTNNRSDNLLLRYVKFLENENISIRLSFILSVLLLILILGVTFF